MMAMLLFPTMDEVILVCWHRKYAYDTTHTTALEADLFPKAGNDLSCAVKNRCWVEYDLSTSSNQMNRYPAIIVHRASNYIDRDIDIRG